MPKEEKKLLVILDNLERFSEKLFAQLIDDSELARKQLIQSIQHAHEEYNKPSASYLTGWLYYFSRTRGPQIANAIERLELEPVVVSRLESFKSLIAEGEWNIGSFNYYLFLELIKLVPEYESLEESTAESVIKCLHRLLMKKIDSFLGEHKLTQRLIDEREKERQILSEKTQPLGHVALYSSLLSAKFDAEYRANGVNFCLTKTDKWELIWIDHSGLFVALPISDELLSCLERQPITKIELLNKVVTQQIKKECLRIRDAFYEKTTVLINPKHPKTELELSDRELCARSEKASFVVRGKSGTYTISWINTMSKVLPISLDAYPALKDWLSSQEVINSDNLIQLKAYLSQVNTAQTIAMSDFKAQLQNCLLRKSEPKKVQERAVKSLNLTLYTDLERCISRRVGPAKIDEEHIEKDTTTRATSVKKLDLSKFSKVTTLFATKNTTHVDNRTAPTIGTHL